jgi:hypothetical protein
MRLAEAFLSFLDDFRLNDFLKYTFVVDQPEPEIPPSTLVSSVSSIAVSFTSVVILMITSAAILSYPVSLCSST